MNIEINDELIKELIEKEIRNCVHNKIVNVMNQGCANWFAQDNIKYLTQDAVYKMINRDYVDSAIKELNATELSNKISQTLSTAIARSLFDIYTEE